MVPAQTTLPCRPCTGRASLNRQSCPRCKCPSHTAPRANPLDGYRHRTALRDCALNCNSPAFGRTSCDDVDSAKIQEGLGHANIATTRIHDRLKMKLFSL